MTAQHARANITTSAGPANMQRSPRPAQLAAVLWCVGEQVS